MTSASPGPPGTGPGDAGRPRGLHAFSVLVAAWTFALLFVEGLVTGREAGMARVYIGAGREAGIRPGDLVGAIANEAKVRSSVIGAIEIEDRFSLVDVPESMAHIIIDVLGRAWIKGRKVPVRLFRE